MSMRLPARRALIVFDPEVLDKEERDAAAREILRACEGIEGIAASRTWK